MRRDETRRDEMKRNGTNRGGERNPPSHVYLYIRDRDLRANTPRNPRKPEFHVSNALTLP